ncbi:SAM-dependent methyltransferase [Psychromonas sp. CNPT3]|nr:hypothetical protein [Psychromonas sp. CNPT3]AGH81220.1 SAM-dependent methyltransferase [Psychromonas sp. CNPT3]
MQKKLMMPGQTHDIKKMPGHWILAQLGKKAWWPGGKKLTETMLQAYR